MNGASSQPADITVIEPVHGWRMVDLQELWRFRELAAVLVLRDLKVRYKQTVLGVAWAVLRPLLTMVIFSVIFGGLAKMPSEGYPYPVFVYSALLPWTFFATAVSASGASLVSSAQLVSKVYFPRLIIPLAAVCGGLVDLAVSTAILFVLMAGYGVEITVHLLAAPVLLLAVVLTALGVGTLLAALTVAFRDFKYLVPFLVQTWMYLTPVIYPVDLFPERWRWLTYLNPMTGLVEGFRAAFLGKAFNLPALASSFFISLLFFVLGVAYFERVERRFADII